MDERTASRTEPRLGDRFRIEGMLGEGGMGVVYEAWDEQRGALVALKTLVRASPALIYQFKQEFRALSDVVHPNLVTLYDLMHTGGIWLLSMELVRGADFITHVRGASSARLMPTHTPSALMAAEEAPTLHAGDFDSGALFRGAAKPDGAVTIDESKMRVTLAGLTRGLSALHGARKLHRDVKPSNVLCTPDGRAVLLDFGLVAELPSQQSRRVRAEAALAGTPAYMAPELFAGERATPASDWYAVGAMLYEALTGSPPFLSESSSFDEFMQLRRDVDPPSPAEIANDVDGELAELCLGLLTRSPTHRLDGDDVLSTISGPRSRTFFVPAAPESVLLGRQRELAQLNAALADSRAGAVTVHVRGSSGMGKSSVIRTFIDRLRENGEALVLEGRCYEREFVAYKGLDSLVDALSSVLSDLDVARLEELLPSGIHALGRIFPVLKRVPAILRAARSGVDAADPSEQRRQAFVALRELFTRLARQEPVVLWIDDLQWSDADSIALVAEILAPPDAPQLLAIFSYRNEEGALDKAAQLSNAGSVRELELGPLTEAQACELALALGGSDLAHAELIARESRGNPLFVHELVRLSSELSGRAPEQSAVATLDDLIAARVERLPLPARNLLEVVAVAGRPIDVSVLRRAVTADDLSIATLRAASMVRASAVSGRDGIEALHDRIRETVVGRLDPDRLRDRHRRLAEALEDSELADAEALAEHWRAAAEPERAASHTIRAADQARAHLAFDRAQKLYRLALELIGPDDSRASALYASLGDVLASDGRCAEAADAMLRASLGAAELDALELRRKAGEQLLISGHIDEGLDVLGAVLEKARIKPPRSPALALAGLLAGRARLKLRGTRSVERDAATIPQEQLTRIDLCWAASAGLGMVDNIRGAYFQTQHLLLALECGEPYRVARALAMEVGYRATAGRRARQSAAALSREALALAERIGHPHTLGLATITSGMTSFLRGDWQVGYELIARGEGTLREHCRGVVSERTNAMLYMLRCLLYLGRLAEVCDRLPPLMDEAEERGNLYAMTYLKLRYGYLPRLRDDDVGGARDVVASASRRWSKRGFHLQHYLDVFARAEIELYADYPERAERVITDHMPQIRRSLILRVQHLRIEMLHLRARTLLALARDASSGRQRRRLCGEAEKIARELSREQVGWANALAELVRAGVGSDRASAHRAHAIAAFEQSGMQLHAAAARYCTSESDAARSFEAEGVANPARWVAMLTG